MLEIVERVAAPILIIHGDADELVPLCHAKDLYQAMYRPAYETAVSVLPRIRDEQLIREAERVLEKANQSIEKMFG